MARFHLYFLRQGMLVGSESVDATDERDAARLAREHSDGRTVELWDATRRIRIIAPSMSTEPVPARPRA